MAEALQPGTFRSIVAVEPILHSPMMMELMLSNPLDANPLSAGARRRRADFQSRYARHHTGHAMNGAHENKDGGRGDGRVAREEAATFFASRSLFKPWDRRALDAYVVRSALINRACVRGLDCELIRRCPAARISDVRLARADRRRTGRLSWQGPLHAQVPAGCRSGTGVPTTTRTPPYERHHTNARSGVGSLRLQPGPRVSRRPHRIRTTGRSRTRSTTACQRCTCRP